MNRGQGRDAGTLHRQRGACVCVSRTHTSIEGGDVTEVSVACACVCVCVCVRERERERERETERERERERESHTNRSRGQIDRTRRVRRTSPVNP